MTHTPLPDADARLRERNPPASAPVMRQKWRHLLFLHWAVEPETVQRRLPQGLTVDRHEDMAWIGVVPFFMQAVRPSGLPCVPWLSNFLELNVRTYAIDRVGRPGVWFDSLDCNQPVAVEIARRFFHLNYRHAVMSATHDPAKGIRYRSRLRKHPSEVEILYSPDTAAPGAPAPVGSLEFFLVERYRLFAANTSGSLLTGRVHHVPYEIQPAQVAGDWTPVLQLAGLPSSAGSPHHICHSHGVDVTIYPMERL